MRRSRRLDRLPSAPIAGSRATPKDRDAARRKKGKKAAGRNAEDQLLSLRRAERQDRRKKRGAKKKRLAQRQQHQREALRKANLASDQHYIQRLALFILGPSRPGPLRGGLPSAAGLAVIR